MSQQTNNPIENQLPLPRLKNKHTLHTHTRSKTQSANFQYPQLNAQSPEHQSLHHSLTPISNTLNHNSPVKLKSRRKMRYQKNGLSREYTNTKNRDEERELNEYRSLKVSLKMELDGLTHKKQNLQSLYQRKQKLRVKLDKLNDELNAIKNAQYNYPYSEQKEKLSHRKNASIHLNSRYHKIDDTIEHQKLKLYAQRVKMQSHRSMRPQYFNYTKIKTENSSSLNKIKAQSTHKKMKRKIRNQPVEVVRSYQPQPRQLNHRCLQCCNFSLKRQDIALKNVKALEKQIEEQKNNRSRVEDKSILIKNKFVEQVQQKEQQGKIYEVQNLNIQQTNQFIQESQIPEQTYFQKDPQQEQQRFQ